MKILLVLDSTKKVVDEAVRLARERNASITALFVLDSTWSDFNGQDWMSGSNARPGFLDYIDENEHAVAKRAIEDFQKTAKTLPYRIKTIAGRVTDEVLDELESGYDLLVMATPLKRGLEIFRDAPSMIARHAPCPVYLVK